jgi:hypothetical protein
MSLFVRRSSRRSPALGNGAADDGVEVQWGCVCVGVANTTRADGWGIDPGVVAGKMNMSATARSVERTRGIDYTVNQGHKLLTSFARAAIFLSSSSFAFFAASAAALIAFPDSSAFCFSPSST